MHLRHTPLPRSATIGEHRAPPGRRARLSLLEDDMQTVALVVEGSGEWWYEGDWRELTPGWMHWRYPEERKRLRTVSGYRTIVFRFQMQRQGRVRLPRFCAWRDAHEAVRWAEEQLHHIGHGKEVDPLRARCWYDRLLAEVWDWQELTLADRRPGLLERAEALITSRAADPQLDVPALATELGCAESTLYHCFSAHLDHSPLQAIQQQRIGMAKRLLQGDADSIAAVATACGYRNPTTFARAFKQQTGLTPSSWRRLHRPG